MLSLVRTGYARSCWFFFLYNKPDRWLDFDFKEFKTSLAVYCVKLTNCGDRALKLIDRNDFISVTLSVDISRFE